MTNEPQRTSAGRLWLIALASYTALNYSADCFVLRTHHDNQIFTYLALTRNTELFLNQVLRGIKNFCGLRCAKVKKNTDANSVLLSKNIAVNPRARSKILKNDKKIAKSFTLFFQRKSTYYSRLSLNGHLYSKTDTKGWS